MINIRVLFEKKGRAKYIGHLDVSRLMQRALKRAGLPIWYTEGYNPHMYVAFALPLPLGYESECEFMDTRLTEEMPLDAVKGALNAVLPEGIRVTQIAESVYKPSDIQWAEYALSLYPEEGSPQSLLEDWRRFLATPSIQVVKKTKKGPKAMDIRPDIHPLAEQAGSECLQVRLQLPAGLNKNISPNLVLDSFFASIKGEPPFVRVTRTRLLCDGEKEFA